MSRFSAPLMVLACLLYAATPMWAKSAVLQQAWPVVAENAVHLHAHLEPTPPPILVSVSPANGHAKNCNAFLKSCPDACEDCMAAFCASCFMLQPDARRHGFRRPDVSHRIPLFSQILTPHGPAVAEPPPRSRFPVMSAI